MENIRKTIEEQRANRTATYAYRKQAHEENDRASKRVINAPSKAFSPVKPVQRPTHTEIKALNFNPFEKLTFDPI